MDRTGGFGECRDRAPHATLEAAGAAGVRVDRGGGVPARRRPVSARRRRPAPPTAAAAPVPPPPRGKAITLLYSSNLSRRLRAVRLPGASAGRHRAPGDRAGSRARRDGRGAGPRRRATCSSRGRTPAASCPTPGEIERRGRLLASAFGRMGTTALVPGERDLALGLPLLRKLAKQGGIPLLAANLYGRDGKRLFDADKIVDAAGIKIGLFGVSAPPTPDDAAAFKAAGIDARDPAAAAREAVAGLRARGAKIVVALVHVGDANENKQAARRGARHRLGGARAQRHEPADAREGRRRAHARGDDPGQTRRAAGPARRRRQAGVHRPRRARRDRDHPRRPSPPADRIRQASRRHRSGHDARLLRAAPQGDREGDRARERAPAADSRRDHGELVREPDHPARRDHARSAGRRDAGRRLQQGERAARGGRQARRPGHGGAPPAQARRRPGGGRRLDLHRHGGVRRLPRARAGAVEDDQTRARAVRAGARRPRQGPVVRRLPRDRLPADGRPQDIADARAHFANVGCESCHGPAANTAPPPTSAAPSPGVPRRPAAAATPPTSPTASSTTRSSSRPSSAGAHAGIGRRRYELRGTNRRRPPSVPRSHCSGRPLRPLEASRRRPL